MKKVTFDLYEKVPGDCFETPKLTVYVPDKKSHNGAIIIFAGGAYCSRASYEDNDYAEFLADNGYLAFTCSYRVAPHHFPIQLVDARRAVRTVRRYAEKYGIDRNKIAVMGSSAGGHLASLVSTYKEKTDYEGTDEIDGEDCLPNAQILAYPVIKLCGKGSHRVSTESLLGGRCDDLAGTMSTDRLVTESTPQAFIWHTADDRLIDIVNSLDYVKALHENSVPVEYHLYPHGPHGLGLAKCGDPDSIHVSAWANSLLSWLDYIGF